MIIVYPSIIYSKRDFKLKLLKKVTCIFDTKNTYNLIARNGVKNLKMMITSIKLILTSSFYNLPLTYVIEEINSDNRLKKFLNLPKDIPTDLQISEYLSRYEANIFNNIVNSILKRLNSKKRKAFRTYIVDATPVICDINTTKQYIDEKQREKLGLNWGYSRTKKYYLGFKVTMVLDKETFISSIYINTSWRT